MEAAGALGCRHQQVGGHLMRRREKVAILKQVRARLEKLDALFQDDTSPEGAAAVAAQNGMNTRCRWGIDKMIAELA